MDKLSERRQLIETFAKEFPLLHISLFESGGMGPLFPFNFLHIYFGDTDSKICGTEGDPLTTYSLEDLSRKLKEYAKNHLLAIPTGDEALVKEYCREFAILHGRCPELEESLGLGR